MSHFNVLVIGDDPEAQLAPYHEFECTGRDDKYIQDVELALTPQRIDDFSKDRFVQPAKGEDVQQLIRGPDGLVRAAFKWGYGVRDVHGTIVRLVKRTNPNAKWDWYVLGGRFSEKLICRDGQRRDAAKAGEVDWAAIEEAKLARHLPQFDRAVQVIAGRPVPDWNKIREKHGDAGIDKARQEYNESPVMRDLRAARLDPFGETLQEAYANFDRDRFIADVRDGACATYAVVRDAVWHQQGEMGWSGMASNEMPAAGWNAKFRQMIAACTPDTLLSVYDCHI